LSKKGFAFLAVALAAGVAVLTSQLAFAHTRPIRFDPAPGAVLSAAPTKVDSWFTNPLRRDPDWNFLHVTDSQGNRVDVGEPILSADRRQMTANLQPGLALGRYTVNWYGWDDNDGHILGDCYTFYVGQAAAEAGFNDKTRLDGGGTCSRIDVSAREGTPSAAALTPAPAGTPSGGHSEAGGAEEENASSGDDGGGGVPVWALVLGVVGGVAVGGIGGRVVGGRN
jgi:methionine-rich copper-binding protein CopC